MTLANKIPSQNIARLVRLAECQAAHESVTHWAISMRIFGKGDFFGNFISGRRKQCNVDAWFRVMHWFDENWPSDLEWPADIPRLSSRSIDALALPPEETRAHRGAASGTCADGGGDAPSAPFDTGSPLTVKGSGDRSAEGWLRIRKWLRAIGFWTGEVIACASLFIILYVLLILGVMTQ